MTDTKQERARVHHAAGCPGDEDRTERFETVDGDGRALVVVRCVDCAAQVAERPDWRPGR